MDNSSLHMLIVVVMMVMKGISIKISRGQLFLPSEPIRRSRVGSGNPSATRFLKKARRRPGLSSSKGKKRSRSKKPPKIFLTRLPLNELQDPEIFFTKIIKEDDSSVEIVPSDLGPDQLEALAQSPSLMFEEVIVNV